MIAFDAGSGTIEVRFARSPGWPPAGTSWRIVCVMIVATLRTSTDAGSGIVRTMLPSSGSLASTSSASSARRSSSRGDPSTMSEFVSGSIAITISASSSSSLPASCDDGATVAAVAADARSRGRSYVWWVAQARNASAHAFYRTLASVELETRAFAVVLKDFDALAAEHTARSDASRGTR